MIEPEKSQKFVRENEKFPPKTFKICQRADMPKGENTD